MLALALAFASLAEGQMPEKRTPTFEEMTRMRVVLTVPGMEAVRVRRELVYKTAVGQPLHLDVYSPAGEERLRPAVILIHGGPIPMLGARKMGVFTSYGEILAASGFVAIAFDHRFLAAARLADAGADVADLVNHVRTNAGSLGVDPDHLALWAFSGGGQFLVRPLLERPTWLRAVVAFYAILDLAQPSPPEGYGEIGQEERQAFSAVRALGHDAHSLPPMLVARAGLDHPWINSGIDHFVQEALAKGAALDLLNHSEGRHGFDILDDDARTRQIIGRTLDFLREALVQRR
jgi:acetyl esterase/lipase